MSWWKIRLSGLLLFILGGFLFVAATKVAGTDPNVELGWNAVFLGILCIFSTSFGFGLMIMPRDEELHFPSEDEGESSKSG
jgi:ABC-type multidrug transport system permease subunit